MTEVEFHTGVADPLAYACRLLRKASKRGVRVLVTAPAARLARLDRALWDFEDLEFLPHVRMPGASAAVAARTPIWLAERAGVAGQPALVLNLGAAMPVELGTLERLIEVISTQAEEVAAGRERWRAYQALGLPTRHHAPGAAVA